MICDVEIEDYAQLIDIWERSVRATHHFLSEADLRAIKENILTNYFSAVTLKCIKNSDNEITGFSGISGQKLEMLFVSPAYHGQGVGSCLCRYAIKSQGVSLVDVNEQNTPALKFYEKIGFKQLSRSPVDGEGRPYPILHLSLGEVVNPR